MKVIKDREAEFVESNYFCEKRKAFLDILLNAKNENLTITSKDLQDEVDTFMFEGLFVEFFRYLWSSLNIEVSRFTISDN